MMDGWRYFRATSPHSANRIRLQEVGGQLLKDSENNGNASGWRADMALVDHAANDPAV